MKVIISPDVHHAIEEFYDYALLNHPTLSESTVIAKMERLYESMYSLSEYAHIYPTARLKTEWIKKGYQEYICEDFHFAYEIAEDELGTELVIIQEACHSLLYCN